MEYSGRAWRVVHFGEPLDAVELQDLKWDEPAPGHVLIRVRTAGGGYPDLMMAKGDYPLTGEPPIGLGEEAAGEVVAVPPRSRFKVGDTVTGITAFLDGWGGFADYAYVREDSAISVPAGMTDVQAGGFPIAFRSAYAALVERGPLTAGQTLLVLGAAGSVGSAAMQLGKALGATVIAVVGSQEKADFCARYGADHVLNHRTDDLTARIAELTGGHGVDLIYDPVGGDTAALALKSLARGGSILLIGLASGSLAPLSPMDLLLHNHTAVGVLAVPQEDPAAEAAVWGHLRDLAASGAITTPVGTVYDFAEVPQMIARQAAPPPGKSVVRVRA
jgi:NADPH2:quinone reductase